MADNNRNTGQGGALALGGVAAIASIIAILQGGKRASAAPGQMSLDDDTLKLLMAIAQGTADIDQTLADIANGLFSGGGGGDGGGGGGSIGNLSLQVQGYPSNANGVVSTRVLISAVNTAYQLPDIVIPDGMALQLKGFPTNAGLIYVGRSAATATNVEQIWPLLPNEPVGYYIKNANALYVSGTRAGDYVAITVEQKGR